MYNLENADISKLFGTKVQSEAKMFNSCSSLKIIDLSKFNSELITSTFSMFSKCASLISINFGE